MVDVSKEFYHFPTNPADHPYLGLIHPLTGEHYWYRGLPMGRASSPAIAGQGVVALMRDLLRDELFQGEVVLNDVTNHLRGEPYRPDWPNCIQGLFHVDLQRQYIGKPPVFLKFE